jgi:hypothetical protein
VSTKRKLVAIVDDCEVLSLAEVDHALHISEAYYTNVRITEQQIAAIGKAKKAIRYNNWEAAKQILDAAHFTEVALS